MRLPGRWRDYFLAMLLMSLAWPLRGQFGHLKGALIPGAAGAVMAAFLGRSAAWKNLFPRAVLFGSVGFSLGGHLSYGWLIERLLDCQYISCLFMDLFRIFCIGAVWGGVGMTFLGFVYSEKRFTQRDFFLLAGFLAFLFFFLDFLGQESFDLALLAAGLFVFHLYNLFWKRSKILGVFGLTGILGFGGGFAGAVFMVYLGANDFLKGPWPWWTLRDQVLGAAGGVALAWAVRNLCVNGLGPFETSLSKFEEKAGFFLFAAGIPALNTFYVFRHWIYKHSIVSGAFFYLLVVVLAAGLLTALFFAAREKFLACSLCFVWFLSFLAIAKSFLPYGFRHWELGFLLFPIQALILSIVLLIRAK